nr:unnamed protein product [Callosobruchus chinensis]
MYSVLHHRARRSPSGEDSSDCHRHLKRKPIMCCAQSAFSAMHEADSEIRNLCFREVTGRDRHETPMRFEPFRCEGMEKRRDEINCVFQCVAQKKGLVDDSGKVVEVSFMEYVKQFIAEAPYMATAMEKVAQDCMKQVNTNITLQGNCYSSGIKLAHCLFR